MYNRPAGMLGVYLPDVEQVETVVGGNIRIG